MHLGNRTCGCESFSTIRVPRIRDQVKQDKSDAPLGGLTKWVGLEQQTLAEDVLALGKALSLESMI